MINKRNFFYASDLAQLYNISKQTLIFYDKKDLFKPDYVDSNGYRMYSLKQFFILGIILDLKTMGFHLNDIKNFWSTAPLKIRFLCSISNYIN